MNRRELLKFVAAGAAGLLVPEPQKFWQLDRSMIRPAAAMPLSIPHAELLYNLGAAIAPGVADGLIAGEDIKAGTYRIRITNYGYGDGPLVWESEPYPFPAEPVVIEFPGTLKAGSQYKWDAVSADGLRSWGIDW
jgi:hypothetical protein